MEESRQDAAAQSGAEHTTGVPETSTGDAASASASDTASVSSPAPEPDASSEATGSGGAKAQRTRRPKLSEMGGAKSAAATGSTQASDPASDTQATGASNAGQGINNPPAITTGDSQPAVSHGGVEDTGRANLSTWANVGLSLSQLIAARLAENSEIQFEHDGKSWKIKGFDETGLLVLTQPAQSEEKRIIATTGVLRTILPKILF